MGGCNVRSPLLADFDEIFKESSEYSGGWHGQAWVLISNQKSNLHIAPMAGTYVSMYVCIHIVHTNINVKI